MNRQFLYRVGDTLTYQNERWVVAETRSHLNAAHNDVWVDHDIVLYREDRSLILRSVLASGAYRHLDLAEDSSCEQGVPWIYNPAWY